jgi:hypothetical protein
MKTIQHSFACIRGLQQEELDLVGGAFSTETAYAPTLSTINTPGGNVTVQDDGCTTSTLD